jgi:contractile injection system tube protein
MPQPVTLATATFQEVYWDDKGTVNPVDPNSGGKNFQVQFNPQTLKLTYSNQKAGGDQPKGSSTQFVGRGVTKLSLELWFDIALAQQQNGVSANDVRQLTQEVVYFMIPKGAPASSAKNQAPPPPGLQIQWGAFTFAGNMDSLDETLDFFSSDGYPLRSSLTISITRQEIQYDANAAATLQNPQSAGLQPYTPVQRGQTFQQMAANAGSSSQPGAQGWQGLALANSIENPRLMAAGALVNVSANASVSVNAQLGVTPQTSGPLSLTLGTSGGASGGVSLGFVSTTTTNGGSGFQASAGFSIGN